MRSVIDSTLADVAANVGRLAGDGQALTAVEAGAAGLVSALGGGGKVYAAGNGGSLCDAMHFAEELSGSFRDEREPLPATAIADAAHLTCVANDFGFERVFERYVRAHLRSGDALVAISTSGMSPNVLRAARAARELGGFVLALTGRPGSLLGAAADVEVCTPAGAYSDRVQELHIVVIHLLVELVERSLFPSNYDA
ncbi:MAG TPA: SIS domain-containing protein [Baekduia sp.]|uniref:D-sedoheptulose-7-phosphate isomerase n=1 Tax=Baekduia sp. TaxID=2600305 RepID=UPI002CC6A0E6|nr:SIS domain-containing protein [Baekduia sp.]HMJ36418.1 SIS domain-containing protein [Baekduia sp.]